MIMHLLPMLQEFSSEMPQISPEQEKLIAALSGGLGLVILVIAVLAIAGMWKVFSKAGEPGWAAIIPFYNYVVLLKISSKPIWWIVLLILCPGVNLVIFIITCIQLAKNFGKGTGYGIGLVFLAPIFFPMLGFGDARYIGVKTQ